MRGSLRPGVCAKHESCLHAVRVFVSDRLLWTAADGRTGFFIPDSAFWERSSGGGVSGAPSARDAVVCAFGGMRIDPGRAGAGAGGAQAGRAGAAQDSRRAAIRKTL